jgi:hypothetical protein
LTNVHVLSVSLLSARSATVSKRSPLTPNAPCAARQFHTLPTTLLLPLCYHPFVATTLLPPLCFYHFVACLLLFVFCGPQPSGGRRRRPARLRWRDGATQGCGAGASCAHECMKLSEAPFTRVVLLAFSLACGPVPPPTACHRWSSLMSAPLNARLETGVGLSFFSFPCTAAGPSRDTRACARCCSAASPAAVPQAAPLPALMLVAAPLPAPEVAAAPAPARLCR